MFSVCAVTRAMGKSRAQSSSDQEETSLADSFMVNPGDLSSCVGSSSKAEFSSPVKELGSKVCVSRGQLMIEQKWDITLAPLLDAVKSESEIRTLSTGYFLQDGVLMPKWASSNAGENDDWSVVMQVVILRPFRSEILTLAHDNPFAGHLRVHKTYDRILRSFFWPGLKRDVWLYCRTCHICQVSGKPNQTLPPYPLYPIPAVGEPFDHVVVDCVGPLPRTKAGNKFLLTVMCSSTRFPEAIPLRKITASTVVKALMKFFLFLVYKQIRGLTLCHRFLLKLLIN